MVKIFKKTLAVILSVVMIVLSSSVAFAADKNDIIILYTNDVHCAIDGYAVFAAYKTDLMYNGYENILTVDNGDAIQGEVIGTLTQGEALLELMNNVGYSYAIPGNHEYDYGMDTFLDIAENQNFNYISCNFVDLTTGETVFEPYYIEEIGGMDIAFVGIATPESITKSTPAYFQNDNGEYIYGFSENNLAETVQSAVNSAKKEGVDVVVAMSHLGIEGTTDGWKSTDILAATTGIDVFLDAHSHETIAMDTYKNADNEDVILSSTGTKFENFGQLTISADGTVRTELIVTDDVDISSLGDEAQAEYSRVKEISDGYNSNISYLFDPIGTSEVKMTVYDKDGNWLVRHSETNMGDFVADAYRARTGADIAFVNGGGVRAEIEIGDVSRHSLMSVNPWSNSMCVVEATGQQILDALEHGARLYPENSGGFLQVSGLTYTINPDVESPVTVDSTGSFVSVDGTKPRRVSNVKVAGKAIDPEATYTVTATEYMLLSGGDGFTMFKNCTVATPSSALASDAQMLIDYCMITLDGKITAEQYGKADGRITLFGESDGTQPETPEDSETAENEDCDNPLPVCEILLSLAGNGNLGRFFSVLHIMLHVLSKLFSVTV